MPARSNGCRGPLCVLFGISILSQFRLGFVPELESVTQTLHSNFQQHLPIYFASRLRLNSKMRGYYMDIAE